MMFHYYFSRQCAIQMSSMFAITLLYADCLVIVNGSQSMQKSLTLICIRGFSTTMRYINRHYLSIYLMQLSLV